MWIRYLLETWSQDLVLDVAELEVPTLLLKPGFDADYAPPDGADFMTFATDRSWDGVEATSELVTVRVVEDARLFITTNPRFWIGPSPTSWEARAAKAGERPVELDATRREPRNARRRRASSLTPLLIIPPPLSLHIY